MVVRTGKLHSLLSLLLLISISAGFEVRAQGGSDRTPKLTTNEARNLLRSGYDALQAQKPKEAVAAFSKALKSGQLNRNEMARTFYYRGQAYRLLKQPTNAISDFNSALWLKDALSERDGLEALKMRDAAYRDAGVGGSASSTTTALSAAQQGGQASSRSGQTSSWRPATSDANASTTKSTNPIASFFSGLFKTDSNKKNTATASDVAPATGSPKSSDTSLPNWSGNTQTSRSNRSAEVSGKYVIQIASLRSAAKARTLARQLAREHANLLRGRKPEVESQIVGNMGTFYHVRVKAWPSKQASRELCKKLLAAGLDCLVSG